MQIQRIPICLPSISTPTSWVKALRAAGVRPVKPSRPGKPIKPAQPAQPVKPIDAPQDERDAAAGLIDGEHPSAPLHQAYVDLKRGVEDTSRAPEADRAYAKLKR